MAQLFDGTLRTTTSHQFKFGNVTRLDQWILNDMTGSQLNRGDSTYY